MQTIVLASGSPRRRELLARVGIPFQTVTPRASETHDPDAAGVPDLVVAIARRKVHAALGELPPGSRRWVLGVDTVVELDGRVIGKPRGREEAEGMLRLLSGRVHRVHSGLALLVEEGRPIDTAAACTEVTFRALADEEISFYLESGEWSGVAGAYRIQERGAFLVQGIRGSWSNVVGLPLEVFYGMLRGNGYPF